MQVKETSLLDLLGRPLQFTPYLNNGAYEACPDPWSHIRPLASSANHSEPVLYYADDHGFHAPVQQLLLLLGNNFLTTIFIFIAAFARTLEERGNLQAVTSKQLRHYYLLNEAEAGRLRYKLLPENEEDRESMIWLVERVSLGIKIKSEAIRRDFELFSGILSQADGKELSSYYRDLRAIKVFEVSVEHGCGRNQHLVKNLISVGHQLDGIFNMPRPPQKGETSGQNEVVP